MKAEAVVADLLTLVWIVVMTAETEVVDLLTLVWIV